MDVELHVVAIVLLGVAWLTLVLGLRWQLRTRAVAALPGLATLAVALAGAVAIGDAGRDRDDSLPMMLMFSIELAAVVALVAISAWQPEIHGGRIRAWQSCCGVRRPLVPYTRSRSMWR